MRLYFVKCQILIPALLISWMMLAISCSSPVKSPVTIAVSKQSDAYTQWLLRNNRQIKMINLYPLGIDSALSVLQNCSGLLLTGGEDVNPQYYGQPDDTSRCGEINSYRDSLEMASIALAFKKKLPILGVCRGEQILNVALGGSLIIDIPTDFDTTIIHRQKDYLNCFHPVMAVYGSLLHQISGAEIDTVTSNHHQAINRLAEPLTICAYSSDSLPEAITWKDQNQNGFMLAVQWHPERMKPQHFFSDPIALEFIRAAQTFQSQKK